MPARNAQPAPLSSPLGLDAAINPTKISASA